MTATIATLDPTNWAEYLPYVEYAYNTSFHSSINNTPFFLMHGRDANPLMLDTTEELGDCPTEVAERLTKLNEARRIVKDNLVTVQQRSKERYDLKARPTAFAVNDVVMAKTQKIPKGAISKLYPRYMGPYRVTSVLHDTLKLVPLRMPHLAPKILHADNCRHCDRNTVLEFTLEDLALPFEDPASFDPNLEAEAED
jgi:hypothetical protein